MFHRCIKYIKGNYKPSIMENHHKGYFVVYNQLRPKVEVKGEELTLQLKY